MLKNRLLATDKQKKYFSAPGVPLQPAGSRKKLFIPIILSAGRVLTSSAEDSTECGMPLHLSVS